MTLQRAAPGRTGPRGAPAGKNPVAPGGLQPLSPLPGGGYLTGRDWAISSFLSAASTFTPQDLLELPLLPKALANLASETVEALSDGDGVVRLASSRLDEAPFLDTAFFGVYEGAHANLPDPERGFASSYATECIRTFCLASRIPAPARCTRVELQPVRAPGRATWFVASIDVTGDAGMAAQLVEETLDVSGRPVHAIGYGAPLRPGHQDVAFPVVRGGGTRRYVLTVYGPSGPIGRAEGTFTLDDGSTEEAPVARVVRVVQGRVALEANALPRDPARAFRVRLDHGDWSAWSPASEVELPPLAPGTHRLEVLARTSSNAAFVPVEQGRPTSVALVVSGASVTLVR